MLAAVTVHRLQLACFVDVADDETSLVDAMPHAWEVGDRVDCLRAYCRSVLYCCISLLDIHVGLLEC